MECKCGGPVPADKESWLKACLKQLEPSHNICEQLFIPFLLRSTGIIL